MLNNAFDNANLERVDTDVATLTKLVNVMELLHVTHHVYYIYGSLWTSFKAFSEIYLKINFNP